MNKKVPAHNKEAEESLLSAVMITGDIPDDLQDLNPGDFYDQKHRLIFDAIVALHRSGTPADLVTIAQHLDKAGDLEKAGGAAFLSNIADAAPMAMNFTAYTKIVKSLSINRQVMAASMRVQDKARSGAAGEEVLEMMQSEAMKIQPSAASDKIRMMRDIIGEHLDRIEKAQRTEQGRGYPLGFPNIDRNLVVTGGKLIVIAGRPKMGKTSFAVSCMWNLDRAGVKTGILSIEMPESEIVDKWLSMGSNVDSMKLGRYGGLTPEDFLSVQQAARELSESGILIDESGSIGIEDVKRKCRKMVKTGAQVLFIDQLSQIKGHPGEDRFTRFANNCNEIAVLKKELNVPIFLLAQLNRDLEKRSNKEPIPSDLKMTGSLEEDSDAVIFVYRPEVYATNEHEKEISKGRAILNLALNRHGAPYRDINIKFNKETSYFYQEAWRQP